MGVAYLRSKKNIYIANIIKYNEVCPYSRLESFLSLILHSTAIMLVLS